ncbi:MAG TPA: FadR/GntR family transcriptional regulator [Polyangiales bacterium]|nr:FadR/GntR family transcriptional regulator [Polyangiales bacterium]
MRTRQYKAGSTAEVVRRRIHHMIETGELKPGDKLPAERELAGHFKVSRASLRAALHSIAGMGLLQFRHGSGTYITDGPPVLDEGPLSLLARLHGFSDDEMFEARRQLEVGVAALAAERATAEDLAQLRTCIEGMAAALDNPRKYLVHDMDFHRAVAVASKNPILGSLVEMVSAALFKQRSRTVAQARDLAGSLTMHRRIAKAIESHDGARARDAMNQHLLQAQRARKLEQATPSKRSRKAAR